MLMKQNAPRTLKPGANLVGMQERAARLSLASNGCLVIVKIAAGIASGSISVLAEGIQSTVDVAASALILVSLRAASAPPDRRHPYGHGKFENLASLGQMLLILSTVAYLLWSAWQRWLVPEMPRVDWGIAALVLALGVNGAVARHLSTVAKVSGSQALEAEAAHLRADMLACLGVLGGLLGVAVTGNPRFDPAVAAIMTLIAAFGAVSLLRETLRPLLDESLPEGEQVRVREVLDGDPRVLGYHRLRTRRAGSGRLVDLHVMLDDRLSFAEAHRQAEEVEQAIRRVLPNADVIVHAEPYEEEMRHQAEESRGV